MRRFLIVLAVLLSAVLIAGSVFAFVTVRKSFPDTSGEVRVNALRSEVTVHRDDKGIPQIYADNSEDLFLAQGYVHAQDRFFEMDFRRHVTSGRLAELVGDGALDTDKYVRTLGWRRVAEQEVELLDPETKTLVEAYSRGVNSYINDKSGSELSLEYAILGITGPDYRPAAWTPADSLAWVKAMAWDLRSNMSDEITRALSTKDLTPRRVEELYPDYPKDHDTIVGEDANVFGGTFDQDGCEDTPDPVTLPIPLPRCAAPGLARTAVASLKSAQDGADALPALLGIGDGIGSNSWVVDGDHSVTGKPILANDPHLAPSMPGIWYQVGLHCRTVSEECPYDVAGFSFSGMPGVVVGHNKRVAWGVTTMYADVADLYLEKVSGDTYEFKGKKLPLETRRETFKVAGGKTEHITVRSTRHGPILSDLDDDIKDVGTSKTKGVPESTYEVALRWTALTPRPTIEAVFALDTAQNWDDFRAAAKLFTIPSQNLVYADVDGNIGYQAPGVIPIREKGDGRWPVPGWTGEHEWVDTIPFEALPSVYNPDEGFIVTANNKVIGDQYPLELGADTADGYRSQRIRELITASDKNGKNELSVSDMTTMQMDTYSPNAEQLVPLLLDVKLDGRYYRQGQATLEKWDYKQTADSAAAAYFNVVWRNLLKLTFDDELPKGQGPEGGERWFTVVGSILDKPRSEWWDDVTTIGRIESRDDILAEAMRNARDELTMLQSRHTSEWSWGRLHQLELVNPTLGDSGIGVIEALFNRGPFNLAGGGGIVDATAWDATEGYDVIAVPSMRMVIDLDNLDRSRWIQLTGNSGHAFQEHYLDQAPLWAEGKTLPWAFSPKAVKRATEDTLTMKPSVPRG